MSIYRVLVVESHPQVLGALAKQLAQLPGIQVIGTTAHPEEAIRLALALQPHVILLEPKQVNALRLVRQFREVAPDGRILIHTSYDDLWEKEALLQAGASDYLLKAFNLNHLWHTIQMAPVPPEHL